MIKKQIQKHNFLNGGPVLQYEIPLFGGIDVGNIIIGEQNIFTPQFILNDENGNNIFRVTRDMITYQDQPLVTEDRLREILREMMNEHFMSIRG